MRKKTPTLALLGLLLPMAAAADFTFELRWSDTGTPSLDLATDPTGPSPCTAQPDFSGATGRCLELWLVTDEEFTAATLSVGWDGDTSALVGDATGSASDELGVAVVDPALELTSPSAVAGVNDCIALSGTCDTAYGSFGRLRATALPVIAPPGYRLGFLFLDTARARAGTHEILGFERTGIDAIGDASFAVSTSPTTIGSATIVVPTADTDADGVNDDVDNCRLVANADQADADADGCGNLCDPDANNDGITNIADFLLLQPCFNQPTSCEPTADFNQDGTINIGDFNILQPLFNQPPGQSGLPASQKLFGCD